MATTTVKILTGAYKDKEAVEPVTISGTGAPADGDTIATDITTYPIGSTLLDTTNSKVYHRFAVAGVAADWVIVN